MPYPSLLHPEPLSLCRPPLTRNSIGDAQTQFRLSLCGGPWVLVCTRFVWALWASVVGMGFDSKCEFTPPTILLGLLLCCWTWGITSKSLQHLPSCWGFSDLGHGVSPQSLSSAMHPLLQCHAENSMDYIVHGVANSWTQLSNFHTY